MPTASVAKVEKQTPSEPSSSIKQGIVIVEHKIRNLEKRKGRLEYYQDLLKDGKELAKDQIAAIAKYNEVIQTLEFARELSVQLNNVATESAKAYKKQQRKEAQERAQHELNLIKDALMIQEVLSSLGQENVREDFLQGKAGITLTTEELQQFDDLYIELTPKHEETTNFIEQFQSPAEHLLSLLEGKPKQAVGTTFAALKEKIMAITTSGYFDHNSAAPVPETTEPEQPKEQPAPVELTPEPVVEQPPVVVAKEEEEDPEVVAESGQVLSCTFQSSVVTEEVRAIDPTYYASSHLSVFKSGTIDFMQDNELDTPDVDSIPTLTYTNQSYTPVETTPPQPQPTEGTTLQNETDDKEWATTAGSGNSGGGDTPNPSSEWIEQPHGGDSWASMAEQQWQQTQPHNNNNDGFIPAGGSGRGRGGRGRGGGGDRGGNKGGPGRGGRGGGGPNRGGYNRDGNYRDNGYYQNGYRERGDRGGRGGSRGIMNSDRPTGGRGRGGRGGYRGGTGGGNTGCGGYNRQ